MVGALAAPVTIEIADQAGLRLHAHRAWQFDAQIYDRFTDLIGMALGRDDFLRATVRANLETSIAPLTNDVDAGTFEVTDPYKQRRRVLNVRQID